MKPFNERPPQVGTPDWSTKFTAWWWRKCKHHGVDPVNEFDRVLDQYCEESDKEDAAIEHAKGEK